MSEINAQRGKLFYQKQAAVKTTKLMEEKKITEQNFELIWRTYRKVSFLSL